MKSMIKLQSWYRRLCALWHYWRGATYRHWANRTGDTSGYRAAALEFDLALDLDPTMVQAYLDRGILYWRELDHPRRAIMDLSRALDLRPDLHEARFNRGLAYQQLREYDRALEEFNAYVEVGEHPHWCEYARTMIEELHEWVEEEEHA